MNLSSRRRGDTLFGSSEETFSARSRVLHLGIASFRAPSTSQRLRIGKEAAVSTELFHSHLVGRVPEADRDRVALIAAEAARAFEKLGHVRKAVALFGSAQAGPAVRWGEEATSLARRLAEAGFAVLTGGGPGLMASANEGARGHRGLSIGLSIDLRWQEDLNPYVELEVPFHYFFLRKLAFVKYSCAFVCMPGGFGTLDELFEALNLVSTHKLDPFPVLLYGSEYWHGLVDWLRGEALPAGTLTRRQVEMLEVVDETDTVVDRVRACHETLCRSLGIAG